MVRRLVKKFVLLIVLPLTILGFYLILTADPDEDITKSFVKKLSKFQPKCKDWNDYEFIKAQGQRKGYGERGGAFKLTEKIDIELNEILYNKTGFSVVVSDKISVNRSILDCRPEQCRSLKNLSNLPKVSIIIIFNNEVKSVLLRTIHSVINRTPQELLHEIILVNDNSENEELYEPLQLYVEENFPKKVKIKNLTERKGLIVTRLEGARDATGEVLVFFDSHVEVGYNWLPPLLEPIAINRRLATVPVIDDFDSQTFEVFQNPPFGSRGGIDWWLVWHTFTRYLPEHVSPIKPFPTPVMLGCAFAIDRKFFLEELGGYDEGFRIWNGENYELSFKLWLCADGLYEVPCSRVTHTFRQINPSRKRKEDFVARNFKRLVEVWFDEYKEIVYSFDKDRYVKVDVGDLTKPQEVHDRLKCKPFKYFIEEIAPDILPRYPPTKNQPVFASGQIKSMLRESVCIDNFFRGEFDPIGLYYCNELDDLGMPGQAQYFRLNFLKNIVFGHMEHCLDSYNFALPQCSYADYGNQYWKFDHNRHMLINGVDNGDHCLSGNFDNQTLSLIPCDEDDLTQKWKFTYENQTALDEWENIYGYKKFVYGDKEINYDKMLPLDYESC
jgi:polypeptide N-acetylgalactosaminyltransferase